MIPPEVRIPESRRKAAVLLGISLAFVALGATLLFVLPKDALGDQPVLVVRGAGAASLVLFGGAGVALVGRVVRSRDGLILGSTGFEDRSSVLGAGFVPWSDVEALRIEEAHGQRFLIVLVRGPDTYAARGNRFQRLLKASNLRTYGSPIAIAPNLLRIEFDELVSLFRTRSASFRAGGAPVQDRKVTRD